MAKYTFKEFQAEYPNDALVSLASCKSNTVSTKRTVPFATSK